MVRRPAQRLALVATFAAGGAWSRPAAAQIGFDEAPAETADGGGDGDESGELSDHEEVLYDPELEGVPHLPKAPTPKLAPAIRVELRSRLATDTEWEDPREDVIESTSYAIFESTYRRSEDLRFGLGLRARYVYARREDDSVQGRAERYELDVVPLTAYADATLDDGIHLRAGYQVIALGRFDFFSATNFLAVYDLRQGLTTIPEASEVGQPAVRVDVDIDPRLTLTSIYVPFFTPHLVTIYGTDYSMLGVLDRVTPATTDETLVSSFVNNAIDRSELPGATTGGVRAIGLQPTPTEPQGALRLTARWIGGELSLTAGTALERLPAFIISPELEDFLLDPDDLDNQLSLLQARRPLEAEYRRFAVLAADAATDLGPLQVGLEAAFMKNRTFYAAQNGRAPKPEPTDVAHFAARAELIEDERWIVSVEAFHDRALDDPTEKSRRWMTLENGRHLQGVAGAISFRPGRFRFDVAGTATSGPTYVVSPRAEWEAVDGFAFEVGAYVVKGPAPKEFGQPDVSIGGIYDPVDQVFVGARWLP